MIGLIAQEAEKISPNLIEVKKDTNTILTIKDENKNLKDEEVPQDRYKANPCSNPKAKAKGKRITSKYGAPTEICFPSVIAS